MGDPAGGEGGGDRLRPGPPEGGVPASELDDDFDRLLEAGIRRQRITFPESTPGLSRSTQSLGDVSLQAVVDGGSGRLYSQGQIQNICPFRTLRFSIRLEMAGGVGMEWTTDPLPPLETVNLPRCGRVDGGRRLTDVVLAEYPPKPWQSLRPSPAHRIIANGYELCAIWLK